ncbi:hypothetical protein WOLCODRAFT_95611 [Wolfiporia cocos MD-104 SS10]|uniref:IRG-type G domain-containing protein n=1 Tax=Wolfiporia cocos (strain MD-104) TaxID=742152 RepID=A0A2H3J607_WOLCO|nr:hypothetical protein WOLCODRAFT_95611 [Wolfiporia cocos MD-104 SS10]
MGAAESAIAAEAAAVAQAAAAAEAVAAANMAITADVFAAKMVFAAEAAIVAAASGGLVVAGGVTLTGIAAWGLYHMLRSRRLRPNEVMKAIELRIRIREGRTHLKAGEEEHAWQRAGEQSESQGGAQRSTARKQEAVCKRRADAKSKEERDRGDRDRARTGRERDHIDRERNTADGEGQQAGQERRGAYRALRDKRIADGNVIAELEGQNRKSQVSIEPVRLPTREEFEETRRKLGYQEHLIHFAIAGCSGSGKSTLINALRGLRARDSGAARVDTNETTMAIARYPDPDPDTPIAWYDIPGAGTLNIPGEDYFVAQGLFAFDAIIVLYDDRFTEVDVAILENAALFTIPTYIVRSKSKFHIDNTARDDPDESDEEEGDLSAFAKARNKYIEKSRRNVEENLQKAGLTNQRIYLIDAAECLVHLVKVYRQTFKENDGRSAQKERKKARKAAEPIDELVLIHDLLIKTVERRRAEPGWPEPCWQWSKQEGRDLVAGDDAKDIISIMIDCGTSILDSNLEQLSKVVERAEDSSKASSAMSMRIPGYYEARATAFNVATAQEEPRIDAELAGDASHQQGTPPSAPLLGVASETNPSDQWEVLDGM